MSGGNKAKTLNSMKISTPKIVVRLFIIVRKDQVLLLLHTELVIDWKQMNNETTLHRHNGFTNRRFQDIVGDTEANDTFSSSDYVHVPIDFDYSISMPSEHWPEGSLSPDFLQRIRSRNQFNRDEPDNTSSVSDSSSDGYSDQDLIFWDYIGMFFVVAVPLATYLYLASVAS